MVMQKDQWAGPDSTIKSLALRRMGNGTKAKATQEGNQIWHHLHSLGMTWLIFPAVVVVMGMSCFQCPLFIPLPLRLTKQV